MPLSPGEGGQNTNKPWAGEGEGVDRVWSSGVGFFEDDFHLGYVNDESNVILSHSYTQLFISG